MEAVQDVVSLGWLPEPYAYFSFTQQPVAETSLQV